MLEVVLAAGPMAIPLWAVLAFSVAMYPVGFLFGVCSECCCSNATCDGFDLEEAYSHRTGGFEFCGFTVSGNKLIVSEESRLADLVLYGSPGYPIKEGCRVTGPGVPSGTVVTDVSRIWDGDLELGPVMGCCRFDHTQSGTPGSYEAVTSEQYCQDLYNTWTGTSNYSWTECELCAGGLRPEGPPGVGGTNRVVITPQESNGLEITLSNTVDGSPECLTFCGQSGLCGPFEPDEGYGPFGSGSEGLKRNCVRWVCRCYEGTGLKADPDMPNPADWCTVVSTTVVGGPTTNDLDLSAELDAAAGSFFERVEWDFLFGTQEWEASEGDRFCAVYAFVFYGDSSQPQWDLCQYPYPKNLDLDIRTRRVITSRDDYYTIHPCTRCQ